MSQTPVPLGAKDVFLGATLSSEVHAGVTYRMERLLGEGGTARAYHAMRIAPEGQSPVVVKIILPRIVRESGATARLVIQKEAVALGRLNERIPPSPYVVRLVDTGVVPFSLGHQVLELPWLAIEYVNGGIEGTALDERISWTVKATGYAFDPDRAARAVDALSRGLVEIHAEGIVHRDITPGNVLVCGSGDTEMFKISDFGIARPIGLQATFGNVAIGTPGYVAPEQTLAKNLPVGPASDVFAFAAVVYCMLTGEHYFRSRSTLDAYQEVMKPERRSLMEAPALCPELRQRPAAVQAIDAALARSTQPNPSQRMASAREFAESFLPWLTDQPKSVRISQRWLQSVANLRPLASGIERTWLVRHPPGDDRLVLGAAWNGAGHCLAATTSGLEYFDGSRWLAVETPEPLLGHRVCAVKRLHSTTWFVSASGARLVELAREGAQLIAEGPDPSLEFVELSGELEELAVLIGSAAGRPPLLCTRVGRYWLRSIPIPEAASLAGLARIGQEQWLVTGRSHQGRAWAAVFRPLDLELQPLAVPSTRALLCCASRKGSPTAIAVGSEGTVLHVGEGPTRAEMVPGGPDLSAVTVDTTGRPWMASAGCLWTQHTDGRFDCVWRDPSWVSPFVSLHAETGQLLALTVDGAVLECRVAGAGPPPIA